MQGERRAGVMNVGRRHVVAAFVVLGLTPVVCAAQVQTPIPIREQTPGLLAQAKIAPAAARLAAYAEFPGARIVAASIERQGRYLGYSFDLQVSGHDGLEHVQIDAGNGQVIRVEYTVELDKDGRVVMLAPFELMSLARSTFVTARDKASATVENGEIVDCRLRVERAASVYVFDVRVGNTEVLDRVLINAYNGVVISVQELSDRTPL
jgi:uncharacterized membrane protein YkoI